MQKLPIIIVNYKTYPNAYGKEGLALSKALAKVADEEGASAAAAVGAADITSISQNSGLPVFAQHIDPSGFGGYTGSVIPESVKEAGAAGTLINHSEKRMTVANIHHAIDRARQAGLDSCVCTNNAAVSKAIAAFKPDYIAVEPPELIGGDISVSKAQPEIISDTVAAVHSIDAGIPVLCGAGVKDGEDVRKALELGAMGILVASGIVKAADPGEALRDLISGMK